MFLYTKCVFSKVSIEAQKQSWSFFHCNWQMKKYSNKMMCELIFIIKTDRCSLEEFRNVSLAKVCEIKSRRLSCKRRNEMKIMYKTQEMKIT